MTDDPLGRCCKELVGMGHELHAALQKVRTLEEVIRRYAEQDCTLSVRDGDVYVQMDTGLTPRELLTQHELDAIADAAMSAVCDNTPSWAVTLNDIVARHTAAEPDKPAQLVVREEWRLLKANEVIAAGDEYESSDAGLWVLVTRRTIGKCVGAVGGFHRRRVKSATT